MPSKKVHPAPKTGEYCEQIIQTKDPVKADKIARQALYSDQSFTLNELLDTICLKGLQNIHAQQSYMVKIWQKCLCGDVDTVVNFGPLTQALQDKINQACDNSTCNELLEFALSVHQDRIALQKLSTDTNLWASFNRQAQLCFNHHFDIKRQFESNLHSYITQTMHQHNFEQAIEKLSSQSKGNNEHINNKYLQTLSEARQQHLSKSMTA